MGSKSGDGSYLVFDIDDSVTRAVLIERKGIGYGILGIAEATTTIDHPDLDVTVGAEKAANILGQIVNKELWSGGRPSKAFRFLCSSCTSGGLHMMVAGVVAKISAESAQRAALGAGALLTDVFSLDYPHPDFEIVEIMRDMKPDMFLLAGGTDGGAVKQVVDIAKLVITADVRPRFGAQYKLPIIYGGNIEVRTQILDGLPAEKYAVKVVDNVRPVIERENLGPAREAIYDSFMEHVIIHSPGFNKLVTWVDESIVPTQAAIGRILYAYATEKQVNLVAVDVGGITTDVYSIYDGVFNRSLNADIGLTYGIGNVMKMTGVQNLLRWIPKEISERDLRNIIANLMILQPTSLTPEQALVQQAAAREAISLALEHHKGIASRLKGLSVRRTVGDIFLQAMPEPLTKVDMARTQVVVGRGKVFTQRNDLEAALLLLDALQPEGITELMVDRLNVMPHLGMLLKENPSAVVQLFSKECLLRLGTCVALRGKARRGEAAMKVRVTRADGVVTQVDINFGELKAIPLSSRETVKLEVSSKRLFVGEGKGKTLEASVRGGEVGLILDARGRPLNIPTEKRILANWMNSLTPKQGSADRS
jgi:hypothetical protein